MYLYNASYINMQLCADCNIYGDGSGMVNIHGRRFLPDGLYIGTVDSDDSESYDSGEAAMTPMGTLRAQFFLGDMDHFHSKLMAIGHRLTKIQRDKLNHMATFNVD